MKTSYRSSNTRLFASLIVFLLAAVGSTTGCWNVSSNEESPKQEEAQNQQQQESLLGPDWAKLSNIDVPAPLTVEQIEASLSRGAYLAKGPAACGICHAKVPSDPSSPLSGGRVMHDRTGTLFAPNITPDPTGIGDWNLAQIVRAIRSSISKTGERLSLDVHQDYRWMSDQDALALAVYLRSLPPVNSQVERRPLGSLAQKKWGLFTSHSEVQGYVPAPVEKDIPQYGRYLATAVAGCRRCHTPKAGTWSGADPFSGTELAQRHYLKSKHRISGEEDDEEETSPESFPLPGPDIRGRSETGLKDWKVADMMKYLSSGRTPDNKVVDPSYCPWTYFKNMSAADKHAIAIYLKRR